MSDKTSSGASIHSADTHLGTCQKKGCESTDLIPVLFGKMIGQPHGGNPYRRYCRGCGSFGHAVSKDDFKTHAEPHVLPKGAEADGSELVPVDDWDGHERYAKLLEEMKNRKSGQAVETQNGQAVATDGGKVQTQEVENAFECPACGASQFGYPAKCDNCGAVYDWDT